jgi:hypothetical protein
MAAACSLKCELLKGQRGQQTRHYPESSQQAPDSYREFRSLKVSVQLGFRFERHDDSNFNQNLINMLQGSGSMWRATRQVRFLRPMLKGLPLSVLERIGDSEGIRTVSEGKPLQLIVIANNCTFSVKGSQLKIGLHSVIMDEKLTKPSDFEDPDSANHDRAYLKHCKPKTSSNLNPQHPSVR